MRGRHSLGSFTQCESSWQTESDGKAIAVGCCNAAGQGKRAAGMACSSAKTWGEAQAICEANTQGYNRLCTKDEIEAGATEGTGCGFDNNPIWTSTGCGGTFIACSHTATHFF